MALLYPWLSVLDMLAREMLLDPVIPEKGLANGIVADFDRQNCMWMCNKLEVNREVTDGDVDTGPHLLSISSLGDPSAAGVAGLCRQLRSD